MYEKPETRVTLYYFKCRLPKCAKPYGLMHSARADADRDWYHHALGNHVGKIREIPAYLINARKFKAVKE